MSRKLYEVGVSANEPEELEYVFRQFRRLGVTAFDLRGEMARTHKSKQELVEDADGYYVVYSSDFVHTRPEDLPNSTIDFIRNGQDTQIRLHKQHPDAILGWKLEDVVISRSQKETGLLIADLLHPQFLATTTDQLQY